MKPETWERLKRIFRVSKRKCFGAADAATNRTHSGGTQSETHENSHSSISEPIDGSEAAATVAVSRQQTQGDMVAHSLVLGQLVAGRFRIIRFISSGGMGEVFEAWDSELGEVVALKTIRPEIASFPSVIDLFKQEVRQARGISHVNVCRVYEVFNHVQDSGEHIWFLSMELIAGRTLAERLCQHGPLPPTRALDLVLQLVAGLAAAHEHGVVHRDFKSSNVMLVDSASGKTRAVVTDFGLALQVATGHVADRERLKLGTPRYMAPEQAYGGVVGFAADQYALGVVICEMLTGECPMRPDPASGIDKAILPAGHRLNARWESVICRCLEFRPTDRFQHIGDVASALNPVRRVQTPWMIAAAAMLALVLGFVVLRAREVGDRVEAASQLTADTDLTSRPSLSRDGTMVAYSSDRAEAGNLDIWVQRLPSGVPKRLTTSPAEDVDPSLAPDGSAVVFRSERDGGGIYIIDVAGGQERLLARYGRNPHFSPDGRSVTYWVGDNDVTIASGQMFVLSLADGSSVRLASDFKDARFPVWGSDGLHILFSGCRAGEQPMPACSEWWAMTSDGRNVKKTGIVELLRQTNIQIVDRIGGWYGNRVLFSGRRESATSLWELTLPPSSLRTQGKPRHLTYGEVRAVAPSLAEDGKIAFEHLTAALHIWRIDRASDPNKATAIKVTLEPAVDTTPSVSPDGHWLVFARRYTGQRDIWIKDLWSGTESLFFSGFGEKFSPIVDDSGRSVVLEVRNGDIPMLVAATRGQPARPLCVGCSDPTGWFDRNRAIFCREGLRSRIEIVDVATAATTTVLEEKDHSLSEATWSPETQYLLFTSSRDGTSKQVFAVFFPKSARRPVGEWIPVTDKSEFSDRPRWSGDGKIVFYLSTRDGHSCVWAQRFDPESGHVGGDPFPVLHYHNPRFSPHVVAERSFNLSVSGNSVYLNVGEINTSVWVGWLRHHDLLSFLQPSQ